MNLEWLLFAILLIAAASFLVRGGTRRSRILATGVLLTGATLAGAAYWQLGIARQAASQAQLLNSTPRQGRPDGYVSSDSCRACHPAAYDSWHHTFHRTMTQWASSASVVGDFNNVRLELGGKTYVLEQHGEEFWAEMDSPEASTALGTTPPAAPRVRRRLGLLTGSHHMQVYWVSGERGNQQSLFPFAWLIEDRRWVPFHNTFLRDPSTGPVNQTWNVNCINCHATAGQPRPNSQTRQFETRAGELGIACEACHGPAEDHVRQQRNVLERYRHHFSPTPDPTLVNPAKLPSKTSSQVCGQCHSITWIPDRIEHQQRGSRFRPGQDLAQATPLVQAARLSEQPWLTEPLRKNPTFLRDRYWADGMVRVSGREYNGLVESRCFQRGELSCLSCHSMHQPQSPDDQLARRMESNQACVQCHPAIGEKLNQHTHHSAASTGSLCYNCHMPHTTYGLLKAIRSHQIDVPTVEASVAVGRPNACNLCHLDRTLDWTSQHLAAWYGKPPAQLNEEQRSVSAAVAWLLKGDAAQRALIAWSMGWEPAQAASGKDWLAPYLAELLKDPYSAVRFIAARSLRSLGAEFQSLSYDFIAPESERIAASQKVVERWNRQASERTSVSNRPALLLSEGHLQREKVDSLLRERNNLSIDLQE